MNVWTFRDSWYWLNECGWWSLMVHGWNFHCSAVVQQLWKLPSSAPLHRAPLDNRRIKTEWFLLSRGCFLNQMKLRTWAAAHHWIHGKVYGANPGELTIDYRGFLGVSYGFSMVSYGFNYEIKRELLGSYTPLGAVSSVPDDCWSSCRTHVSGRTWESPVNHIPKHKPLSWVPTQVLKVILTMIFPDSGDTRGNETKHPSSETPKYYYPEPDAFRKHPVVVKPTPRCGCWKLSAWVRTMTGRVTVVDLLIAGIHREFPMTNQHCKITPKWALPAVRFVELVQPL